MILICVIWQGIGGSKGDGMRGTCTIAWYEGEIVSSFPYSHLCRDIMLIVAGWQGEFGDKEGFVRFIPSISVWMVSTDFPTEIIASLV